MSSRRGARTAPSTHGNSASAQRKPLRVLTAVAPPPPPPDALSEPDATAPPLPPPPHRSTVAELTPAGTVQVPLEEITTVVWLHAEVHSVRGNMASAAQRRRCGVVCGGLGLERMRISWGGWSRETKGGVREERGEAVFLLGGGEALYKGFGLVATVFGSSRFLLQAPIGSVFRGERKQGARRRLLPKNLYSPPPGFPVGPRAWTRRGSRLMVLFYWGKQERSLRRRRLPDS